MSDIIELSQPLPELRDPAVIAAFAVARRGGRLPARTLSYLMEAWDTQRIARTDLDDIYDLTVARPEVHFEEDTRVIEWPQVHIFHARPEGAGRDLLLLVGPEPNFHWRSLADSLARFLDQCGAKSIVTLRAFPGEVPHTRPAPILLNGTDGEAAARFGGRPSGVRYEGPTDFGSVLSARVEELGWSTADISVQQPYYFPRMPNMQGSIALIGALDHAFGTTTVVDTLRTTAEEQHIAVDAEVADSSELRTLVSELEQRYDSTYGSGRPGASSPTELPPAEDVIRDIEDLFRGSADNPKG